jgi:hypothetical protein
MKILNDIACTLNSIFDNWIVSLKLFNSTIELNFNFLIKKMQIGEEGIKKLDHEYDVWKKKLKKNT